MKPHGMNDVKPGLGKIPEECAKDRGHRDVVTLLQHRDAP